MRGFCLLQGSNTVKFHFNLEPLPPKENKPWCKIWHSRSGVTEESSLSGYGAVWLGVYKPVLQNIKSWTSGSSTHGDTVWPWRWIHYAATQHWNYTPNDTVTSQSYWILLCADRYIMKHPADHSVSLFTTDYKSNFKDCTYFSNHLFARSAISYIN